MNKEKIKKANSGIQIFLLVFGIIATAYLIGQSFGLVSATCENCVNQLVGDVWHYGICSSDNCIPGNKLPRGMCTSAQVTEQFYWDSETNSCKAGASVPALEEENKDQECTAALGEIECPTQTSQKICQQDGTWGIEVSCSVGEVCRQNSGCISDPVQRTEIDRKITERGVAASTALFGDGKEDPIERLEREKSGEEETPGFWKTITGLPVAGWEKFKDIFDRERIGEDWKKAMTKSKGEHGKSFTDSLAFATATWAGMKIFSPLLEKFFGDAEYDALNSAIPLTIFFGSYASKYLGASTGWGIGVAVGLLAYYLLYENERYETHTFSCLAWNAPAGGQHCSKCNNLKFPCSEYQCKSLGQACELINKGSTEEKCVWTNPNDNRAPEITTWDKALKEDYKYTPNKAVSPPARGIIIEYSKAIDKCIPAFTPFTFGVTTDEPAKCRISYDRVQTYDEMFFDFGGSPLFRTEHTHTMGLPGPRALESENITLRNDGEFELYIKCQDKNGNFNVNDFVFKFCVDPSPDTTPPIIKRTNPLNEAPIRANQTEIDVSIYLNEPADCRWSRTSQSYNNMVENMVCVRSAMQMNAEMLYECKTTLTGLLPEQANKYYFACLDQPFAKEQGDRIPNQPFEYTLIGTRPLYIKSVSPNATTISNSTDSVRVVIEAETSAGYKNGESRCAYAPRDVPGEYIEFAETSSHKHQQQLWLTTGNYEYYIKCTDLGGNQDTKKIEFEVETDLEAPKIVRMFYSSDKLILYSDEPAVCGYSLIDCEYDFEDRTRMTSSNSGLDHYASWLSGETYYIKCQDNFGNQPAPNQCSSIVKPFEKNK